mmetsp:Transcript_13936/g.17535  ORF Transcript_13936/g.17535 Transcript_13936/m.17535 type:complete len:1312 (-) Transcript_13936:199-4134(-)|eukprot:CAMPEP_0172514296 /NCGR_PEP_ID=MMETSP1066-20121228/258960_1 /TAXON_ID=671091 /ORGANISM="Coscinodiscus wailesii, Strain CCMP2513" /LENGTH=1311 /DNA_ID=CAMNT_0013294905 /DNA_START=98 /DNA_END=4033 /DNA_ORIENTATION=-
MQAAPPESNPTNGSDEQRQQQESTQEQQQRKQQPRGKNDTSQSKKDICHPTVNDVLFERDDCTNNYPGNKRWRKLVAAYKRLYVSLPNMDKTRKVAESIVLIVRQQNPPGRFLQKDENTALWHDVGEENAILTTIQALRDEEPEFVKEMMKENSSDRQPAPDCSKPVVTGPAAPPEIDNAPAPGSVYSPSAVIPLPAASNNEVNLHGGNVTIPLDSIPESITRTVTKDESKDNIDSLTPDVVKSATVGPTVETKMTNSASSSFSNSAASTEEIERQLRDFKSQIDTNQQKVKKRKISHPNTESKYKAQIRKDAQVESLTKSNSLRTGNGSNDSEKKLTERTFASSSTPASDTTTTKESQTPYSDIIMNNCDESRKRKQISKTNDHAISNDRLGNGLASNKTPNDILTNTSNSSSNNTTNAQQSHRQAFNAQTANKSYANSYLNRHQYTSALLDFANYPSRRMIQLFPRLSQFVLNPSAGMTPALHTAPFSLPADARTTNTQVPPSESPGDDAHARPPPSLLSIPSGALYRALNVEDWYTVRHILSSFSPTNLSIQLEHTNDDGANPVHLASCRDSIPSDLFTLLLRQPNDAAMLARAYGMTPLHLALTKSSKEKKVLEMIEACPRAVCVANSDGRTVLWDAIERNKSTKIIHRLLSAHLSFDSSSVTSLSNGNNPLRPFFSKWNEGLRDALRRHHRRNSHNAAPGAKNILERSVTSHDGHVRNLRYIFEVVILLLSAVEENTLESLPVTSVPSYIVVKSSHPPAFCDLVNCVREKSADDDDDTSSSPSSTLNRPRPLRVIIAGGGPVGLATANILMESSRRHNVKVSIRLYDSRLGRENGKYCYRASDACDVSRYRAVTIRREVRSLLPTALVASILAEGDEAVTVCELGERLLKSVQKDCCCDGIIDMTGSWMHDGVMVCEEDFTRDRLDEVGGASGGFDFLVLADGRDGKGGHSSFSKCEEEVVPFFGQAVPFPEDSELKLKQEMLSIFVSFEKENTIDVDNIHAESQVLNAVQRRFMLMLSTRTRRGCLDMLLTPDESEEVCGVNTYAQVHDCGLNEPRRRPCVFHREDNSDGDSTSFKCRSHDAFFAPCLSFMQKYFKSWQRIKDGLALYNISPSQITAFSKYSLGPYTQRTNFNAILSSKRASANRPSIAFAIGTSAFTLSSFPDTCLNTGLQSAAYLSRTLTQVAKDGCWNTTDFSQHSGKMHELQDEEVRMGCIASMMERDKDGKTIMERIQEEIKNCEKKDGGESNARKVLEQRLRRASNKVFERDVGNNASLNVENLVARLALVSDETIRVFCRSGASVPEQ